MSSTSILGVGQSAMAAAQAGLVTTGHNIANVNTPGYSRQLVIQNASAGQDIGVGYVGKGTEVSTIQRVFNEFLHNQVISSQTSKGAIDSYYAQIKQIDNMLADPTSGVSAGIQDFFKGLQDVAANPSSNAARQAMLSSAQTLAARFQSVGGRLDEMRDGLNGQIGNSINAINNYAQQIATLNDAIEKAQGTSGEGKPANDLLDQRDQVISELSKEIKVSVVKQGNSYNVFMGSGQALTVGTQVFKLVPLASVADPSKVQVGYSSNGTTSYIADSSLTGGRLGGLIDFRANSLEPAQNSLGRVAIGLASAFNAQHQLGQDLVGDLGGKFFNAAAPQVNAASTNDQTAPVASVTAQITDASKLTVSDYRLRFEGGNYTLTRLSDNKTLYTGAAFPSGADRIEGVTLTESVAMKAGDEFVIRPTAGGAAGFSVAVTDIAKIAAGAPIRTALGSTNAGTGKISPGSVSSTSALAPFTSAVTITYNAATQQFSGFPATMPVTVTSPSGSTASFAAGAPVDYQEGSTISFGGVSFTITGKPSNNDTFKIEPNKGGVGDNRNALLLGALQTSNSLGNAANNSGVFQGATLTFQSAYTHMVSQVGNKTHELEVTGKAEDKMLAAAVQAHQSESGVNLDEEAANLMRYQQAYQAAAKVMQTASQLFELLLDLGS